MLRTLKVPCIVMVKDFTVNSDLLNQYLVGVGMTFVLVNEHLWRAHVYLVWNGLKWYVGTYRLLLGWHGQCK